MTEKQPKNRSTLFTILFIILCGAVLLLLFNAPPETTKRLPHDANHEKFHAMGKKEAEKYCEPCHNPKGIAPLPEKHPPKYRCLFCHKKG